MTKPPPLPQRLRITGGTVYDPASGVAGVVRDVCIEDGKVVSELPARAPRLDASGMIVMPGGVDIHSHIAGSSVNHGRRLLPEEHAADPVLAPRLDDPARSGTGGTIPSTFATGYRYAGLGYTTAMEAAVAPLFARHAHAELDDTPIIDAGLFALLGNDEYLFRQIAAGEKSRARDYAAWVLRAAGAYAIKVVNPGGVELWKRGAPPRNVTGLDDPVGSTAVTPRRILETLTDAGNELELPHPVHIHCNALGQPGNAATTLETMRTLAGRRAHFTHLQFHSYGGGRDKGWQSGAKDVIEYVNAHAEVSVDVGQVLFGPATTLTADAPAGYLLHASSGRKWVNMDVEFETGCGIVPYVYKEKAAVAALQWAVGLELFLLATDPWRVVLSTDHPNGGSFLSYPELIRLLMDRAYRDEQLKRVNAKLLKGSALADGLAREYTLNEIAIITRAGPARLLGLTEKGHLGPGADADVTIYTQGGDAATMFATPRYVLKGGTLVVEEGQLRRAPAGRRLAVRPEYDDAVLRDLKHYFDTYASVSFENYPLVGSA
jgi:formylmethanofuran dehydrogenase subunit A